MNQFIEAYLDDTLDQETRSEFEAQLAQNEALREAVAEAKRVREDFSWLAVEQGIKQGEREFWRKQDSQKQRKRWIGLVLGVGLVLLGILAWKWAQMQSFAPAETPEQIINQPSNLDTTQSLDRPAPVPTQDSLKNRPKSIDRTQLFAQYFRPYKDNSMEPGLRGDEPPSPSEVFQQYYWDGKYQEALDQFESLSTTAKANDNLMFLQAECWMALGKAEEAAPIFEAILKRDRTRYMYAAAWHLALANLKMDKLGSAKTQFKEISQSDSKWREEAVALLRRIP